MFTRTIVGAILIVLFAGVVLLDWHLEQAGWPHVRPGPGVQQRALPGLPLAALMMLLVAAGYLELARLAGGAGVPVFRFTGAACAVIVAAMPLWRRLLPAGEHEPFLTLVVLGVVVAVLFAGQVVRYRTQEAIRRIGGTLLAVCYLGVCGAVMLGIRLQFGLKAFVLFLLVVKFTDIGAYYSGTAFGRHGLIPWLSPKKSWEGLFGGLALGVISAVVFVAAANPIFGGHGKANLSFAAAGLFGVVIGLFGQAADLSESLLKRDARLKDSGSVLPGFGGVLDMLDSPLLSAPAAYILLAVLR